MNERERTRRSKFLSLVLRHEPQRIGITLDASGWVEVDDLLTACGQHGLPMQRPELEQVVAMNEKKRFAFSEDGRRIRASQGHSVDVELGYVPQTPPRQLFHGTATRFIDSIRAAGLRKAERRHVHLSIDRETAEQVGKRHGKPAVLTIDAATLAARGQKFFVSENGVWLTDDVPVEFIGFPEH